MSRYFLNRLLSALITGLFLIHPFGLEAENSKPRVTVYFPDYRFKEGVTPYFYGTTNLVLFSAKPELDGTVNFSKITPPMIEMAKAARLKSGLKVTVCVGGWGRGELFATAVSTNEIRGVFVNSLLQFVREHDLDGVDIDWEFPKGEQQHSDFTAFLEKLSKGLHADNRILTVAIGYTRPLSVEAYSVIDQVNLMSYQPWNPEPYEAWLEKAVQGILESGLPPEKLNIGLGFYAKEMGGERRAISFSKLSGNSGQKLPESEFGFSPVGKPACDLRFQLMKKYQLGGVMIWDYGHDSMIPEESLLRYCTDVDAKKSL